MADPPEQPLEYVQDHRSLNTETRAEVLRLLEQEWKPQAIARTLGVSKQTVTALERNTGRTSRRAVPSDVHRGRPSKLTVADEDALFHFLRTVGWQDQHVMVKFLRYERGREVSQSKISRLIKQKGWSREQFPTISISQDEDQEPAPEMISEANESTIDSSSAPLEDLASVITKNASIITDFLGQMGHAQPSFSPHGPLAFPETAPDEVLSARKELISTAKQLQFLALGPTQALQWHALAGVRLF